MQQRSPHSQSRTAACYTRSTLDTRPRPSRIGWDGPHHRRRPSA